MATRNANDAAARRRKQLGQFFTPPHVAAAMVSLARCACPPLPPYPTVADLACGEGALLRAAIEGDDPLTVPERCYGLDIDRDLEQGWDADPLLSRCHLRVGDGLDWDAIEALLPPGGVDLALGNPPYNGSQNLITDREVLARFELGRRPGTVTAATQITLPGQGWGSSPMVLPPTVTSQPIEALFVEQFLNATRPGGYLILILPEGLLANQGSQDVRDLVLSRAELLAVIGLPQGVFDNAAKTDIVMMRKPRPVFLASLSRAVAKGDNDELAEVVELYARGHQEPGREPEITLELPRLTPESRAFLLAHDARAWKEHPPESWVEQEYWRHVQQAPGEPSPEPGDPVLLYRQPADIPGAGLCTVMRVVQARPAEKEGYEVLVKPCAAVEPPLTYRELGALPGLADAWPAYRFRFRKHARGAAVPPAAWKALLPALEERLRPLVDYSCV